MNEEGGSGCWAGGGGREKGEGRREAEGRVKKEERGREKGGLGGGDLIKSRWLHSPSRCAYQMSYSIYSHSKMDTSNEGRDRHGSLNVRFALFH